MIGVPTAGKNTYVESCDPTSAKVLMQARGASTNLTGGYETPDTEEVIRRTDRTRRNARA
jgi:hypothetical protein